MGWVQAGLLGTDGIGSSGSLASTCQLSSQQPQGAAKLAGFDDEEDADLDEQLLSQEEALTASQRATQQYHPPGMGAPGPHQQPAAQQLPRGAANLAGFDDEDDADLDEQLLSQEEALSASQRATQQQYRPGTGAPGPSQPTGASTLDPPAQQGVPQQQRRSARQEQRRENPGQAGSAWDYAMPEPAAAVEEVVDLSGDGEVHAKAPRSSGRRSKKARHVVEPAIELD